MKIKQHNHKHFLWLPYVSNVKIKGQTVTFIYNGGIESLTFQKIHSIMFYGSVIDLPQKFLEECAKNEIPITIHRRNMDKGVWITPSIQTNVKDLLSKQIMCRENITKQNYISRQLIKAKFKSTNWLFKSQTSVLTKHCDVPRVRIIESISARSYWDLYFKELGHPHWIRRGDNPIAATLDAVSKYISSIILRWILYHNLSPYHGYLHVQTEYPALVYDLFDPYRGYFDLVVFRTIKKMQQQNKPSEEWLPACINELKSFLNTRVYTDATRQIVTMTELMHGIVLALRSYLLGLSERFIIPIPGQPNGGRPMKTGYTLYGHRAGRTDFWKEAKRLAQQRHGEYAKIF